MQLRDGWNRSRCLRSFGLETCLLRTIDWDREQDRFGGARKGPLSRFAWFELVESQCSCREKCFGFATRFNPVDWWIARRRSIITPSGVFVTCRRGLDHHASGVSSLHALLSQWAGLSPQVVPYGAGTEVLAVGCVPAVGPY